MGSLTWQPGVSPERRVTPDRRIEHTIQCQETLAQIIAETRGDDSYAAQALKEFRRRKADPAEAGTGEDELVIFSLRGQWLVGTVGEIRSAMITAAAAACRRRASDGPNGNGSGHAHHG
jgi:hypothetical protein